MENNRKVDILFITAIMLITILCNLHTSDISEPSISDIKTYNGTITNIHVDDDGEYHISFILEKILYSLSDINKNDIEIKYSDITTPTIKIILGKETLEYCIKVDLPNGYVVKLFND